MVLASILLGAFLHLLWNGLTHKGSLRGLPYSALPLHLPPPAALFTVYSVLDVLSSVGGVAMVSWLVLRLPRMPVVEVPDHRLRRYWVIAGGTAAILFGLRQLFGPTLPDFWNMPISALSAGMAGVVLASGVKNSKA
ncbi:DUF4184 family protein [Hymenobacter jeongseonensis]|uniref:DUF4184 family protein n=1 Tax=Hymenobacter jeongseonensis TaxID=2791027 RepID=UPI0018AFDE39|nr:DUF4184 family protein [Hymenobacter jeongseonensis]